MSKIAIAPQEPEEGDGAEAQHVIEVAYGSVATTNLWFAAVNWLEMRKRLTAIKQWKFEAALPEANVFFGRTQREVVKLLKMHPIWVWLEPLSGLRGPSVAWIIGKIGDPHRFPRQGELGNGTRALWPNVLPYNIVMLVVPIPQFTLLSTTCQVSRDLAISS